MNFEFNILNGISLGIARYDLGVTLVGHPLVARLTTALNVLYL